MPKVDKKNIPIEKKRKRKPFTTIPSPPNYYILITGKRCVLNKHWQLCDYLKGYGLYGHACSSRLQYYTRAYLNIQKHQSTETHFPLVRMHSSLEKTNQTLSALRPRREETKKNANTNATLSASPPFLPNKPPSLLSTNLNRRFSGPYLFSIQRHRLHPLRLRRNIIPRNLLRLPLSLRQRRTK